jgi:cytochrome c
MNRSALLAMTLALLLGDVPQQALAQPSAERGKQLYANQCMACHAADISLAGPSHRGVFGRRAAAVPDYPYSPALSKLKVTWNDKTLDAWLRSPNQMAPGNRMGFSVANAQDRQDLIAFLKTLKPE